MDPYAGLVNDIIIVLGILAWIGFGFWLTYKTRESGCLERILVAVFFTKAFVLFWFCYGLFYVPGKIVVNFIKGMKEGHVERQQTDQKDKDKK